MTRDAIQVTSKLLLIDGNNLFHRAYHALPPLNSKDGENSNAVFGFTNMLLKAVSEVKPDYIACAFDTAAPTFRHVAFEKYKAQRPPPPADLYPQLPKVKRLLESFGVRFFEKAGYEADDLLASLAAKAVSSSSLMVHGKKKKKLNPMNYKQSFSTNKPSTINVIILSGDRDVLQLVDGAIKVQMPGWNLNSVTLFGSAEVKEKYGITPEQMVDYKAIVGDTSDNVPGIAGIGPKGAADLLQRFGDLETIYKHLDEVSTLTKKKLEASREVALEAKKLVELDRTVDLGIAIEDLKFNPQWESVRQNLEELGFKSIAAKIPGGKTTNVPEVSKDSGDNQLELI